VGERDDSLVHRNFEVNEYFVKAKSIVVPFLVPMLYTGSNPTFRLHRKKNSPATNYHPPFQGAAPCDLGTGRFGIVRRLMAVPSLVPMPNTGNQATMRLNRNI